MFTVFIVEDDPYYGRLPQHRHRAEAGIPAEPLANELCANDKGPFTDIVRENAVTDPAGVLRYADATGTNLPRFSGPTGSAVPGDGDTSLPQYPRGIARPHPYANERTVTRVAGEPGWGVSMINGMRKRGEVSIT